MTLIALCLSSKPNNNFGDKQTTTLKNKASNYYLKLMFNRTFLSNYNTDGVKHFQKGWSFYETNLWVNLLRITPHKDYLFISIEISIYISIVVNLDVIESQVEYRYELENITSKIKSKKVTEFVYGHILAVYTPMASTMLCHVKVRKKINKRMLLLHYWWRKRYENRIE